MKAVKLEKTCKAEEMIIKDIPIPEIKPGWVLVKIKAFGINRSEVIFRSYEANASYITLPRIPGIECVGEIVNPSDSNFKTGQHIVALMGGMGRSFDGSYAEYALLPVSHVFQVNTNLSWTEMAAVPETFFTAYGSLFDCLQIQSEDIILIHAATSALGIAAIQLAKSVGCTVIGTTRKEERLEFLKEIGADFSMLDDGTLSKQIRNVFPEGLTKVLELVGPTAIEDTSKLLKKHGIICSTGQLGGSALQRFDVIKSIPNGVYLSSFFSNYPTQEIIDEIFNHIKKYNLKPHISKVFTLDEIAKAHLLMEQNKANGKIVVLVN
ncbi:zinc-binding dehydrogenase [Clostridium sp. SHJSY1]|uniref:zinc-binding dehydrogenase n=1 Tax=Clostridium sp. SHJSY1 TaxID=2942483 RepID=UPI002876533E|nr:zinc-binding dehydrogenase [Clostridium sp. SHJSY1]MDS0524312.1 zinc-binding dehydrogenase [Clostridium sp. SHJSY1]